LKGTVHIRTKVVQLLEVWCMYRNPEPSAGCIEMKFED